MYAMRHDTFRIWARVEGGGGSGGISPILIVMLALDMFMYKIVKSLNVFFSETA